MSIRQKRKKLIKRLSKLDFVPAEIVFTKLGKRNLPKLWDRAYNHYGWITTKGVTKTTTP